MTAERKQFLEQGKIASGLDVADGFIHLSDLTGPRVVAKLFFTEGESAVRGALCADYVCMCAGCVCGF